jgi:hypothetical protein
MRHGARSHQGAIFMHTCGGPVLARAWRMRHSRIFSGIIIQRGSSKHMDAYVPPHFGRFKQMAKVYGWEQGHETLTMSRSGFLTLMQELLAFADFDEAWYLSTYKDVADAVAQKKIASARDHYLNFGYFEGRLPNAKGFDAEFYAKQYGDVVRALNGSDPALLLHHFLTHGYAEGRRPCVQGSSGRF